MEFENETQIICIPDVYIIAYNIVANVFYIAARNEANRFKIMKEFMNTKEAIDYFETHIDVFVKYRNTIAGFYKIIRKSDNVFLEDTGRMYTGKCMQ